MRFWKGFLFSGVCALGLIFLPKSEPLAGHVSWLLRSWMDNETFAWPSPVYFWPPLQFIYLFLKLAFSGGDPSADVILFSTFFATFFLLCLCIQASGRGSRVLVPAVSAVAIGLYLKPSVAYALLVAVVVYCFAVNRTRSQVLLSAIVVTLFLPILWLPTINSSWKSSSSELISLLHKELYLKSLMTLGMSKPNISELTIPVMRFRLVNETSDLLVMSYFFENDWGATFESDLSPRVSWRSKTESLSLQPVWRDSLQVPFEFRLSWLHLGEILISFPKKDFAKLRVGWIKIVRSE